MSCKAIARVTAAVMIIIIVVLAGVGVGLYYSTLTTTPPTTTTAISSAISSSTAAAPSGTLSIDEFFWPPYDLNPIPNILYLIGSEWWMYTVFQPLVTVNGTLTHQTGDSSQILPVLATDWSVSPDGTTYTFNLRQNVTFSNGDPFNAYQVWAEWYSFYYMTGNATTFFEGYGIFDCSNVRFGPATVALMTSSGLINPTPDLMKIMSDNTWPIYVTGPYQIVIHMSTPFRWLLQLLTTFNGLIFDSQYVLEHGGYGTATGVNTYFNAHPIPGTGPYVTTDWLIGSYEKFTQNPTYWGKNLTAAEIQANPYIDPGHFQTVIIHGVTDDLARYTDLSTGAAQIAAIFTQDFPLVLSNPNKFAYFLEPADSMIHDGIGMNTLRYPTNITAFRQAIVHSVNYTDLNQKVFYGSLSPLVGPEYRAQKDWYNLGNFPTYDYNPTLAKQYLQQSGVDVSKLQPLEFRVVAGCQTCVLAAQVVQADIASVLGVTVTVEVTPVSEMVVPYTPGFASYAADVAGGAAQTEAHLTWMGFPTFAPTAPDPADPWITFVNVNSPTGNFANYHNPVVQKCVNEWFATSNVTAIKEVCTAAYAQVYNDAPYIWLGEATQCFGAGSVAWNKNVVQGFLMDPAFTGEATTAIFNTVTPVS